MSDDSLERIVGDLRTYVKQQQETGMEWYLDEGPVADASSAVVAPEAPVSEPATPVATDAPIAPKAAEPAAPAPTADKPQDTEFQMACDTFIRETLAQIRKYQQQPAELNQQDIFTEPEKAVEPLTPEGKATELATLAEQIANCEACKLHATRTQTVFGVGSSDAKLVFIGEAPGRNEDEQGEPFVGRAGKLLNDILKAIGFARDDIYICNILKCRPPKNRDPERDEVDACEPFLKQQLAILEPKVICCLGRHAAMTLLDTRDSLGNLRKKVHFYEGIPVMATYHPAALLRNPHWKRDTWEDVRKLRALHDALLADKP